MPKAPGRTTIAAPGVTATPLSSDRWRVRWREAGRSRETTFVGPGEGEGGCRVFVAAIAASLRDHGSFTPAARQKAEAVPDGNLLALIEATIDARSDRYTGKTRATYTSYKMSVVRAIHRIHRIPATQPLSVAMLSSTLFDELRLDASRMGVADSTRYGSLRLLMDAWRWGTDKNREAQARAQASPWPGLADAPVGRPTDYVGRTAHYGRTVAPTLAEADAALRHLPSKTTQGTRVIGIVMRYTGLRAAQAAGIHREDLDLVEGMLTVRVGKTAGEKADRRTMPVARAMLAEPALRAWVDAHPDGPLFPKRAHAWRDNSDASEPRTHHATVTFRLAWEAATAAGEARRAAWAPSNRKNARPEHAFRAALKSHMRNARVDDDVSDFLTGHEGDEIRDVHYGRDLLDLARVAVDSVPAIDWVGPRGALRLGPNARDIS